MDERAKQILQLIRRSPDRGDGWRSVSSALWPLVTNAPSDLVELRPSEGGGGSVRLTSDGEAVVRHL